MPKFILIQRNFCLYNIKVLIIEAKNLDAGWEIIEEKYNHTDIQNWLITPSQAKTLATKLRNITHNHAI